MPEGYAPARFLRWTPKFSTRALIFSPDGDLMSLYFARQADAAFNMARCSLGRDRDSDLDLQLAGTKAATATAI